MKYAREFITSTLVGGLFVVVPVYLAALLLLKGMKSVGSLVRPFAVLVPDWIPAERLFSLVLVLALCFLVGLAVRTRAGRRVRERMEMVFFDRLPGYGLAAQSDPATGRRQRRARMAAGLGRTRRRARSGVHHRGTRRWAIHGLRAVGADTVCRRRIRPQPRTGPHSRCPVHAGCQICLALGLWLRELVAAMRK